MHLEASDISRERTSQEVLLQIYHQSQLHLHLEEQNDMKEKGLHFLTGCWWGCYASVGTHTHIVSYSPIQNASACWRRVGGGTPSWARRGLVSSETAPGRLDFQLHDEAFWGETDGSVKPPHAPEVRAAANLAFVMRWLKRGLKWGGRALWRGTTTLGLQSSP